MQTDGYPKEDRRYFERIKLELPIRFKVSPENIEGDFILRDIGGNGLGIISKGKVSPQSNIDLWIKIPDDKPELHIKGKVVWAKESEKGDYRAGIVFEKLDLMPLWRVLKEAEAKTKD